MIRRIGILASELVLVAACGVAMGAATFRGWLDPEPEKPATKRAQADNLDEKV